MKKNWNIIGNRKKFLIGSAVVLLIGLLFNIVFGTALDISFKGGSRIVYSYEGELVRDTVEDFVSSTLGKDATVVLSTSTNIKQIEVSLADALTLDQTTDLEEKLVKQFADNKIKQTNSNTIPPAMGKWFFVKCGVALLLAAALLLVYVAFRFRKIGGFSAAACALLTLLHDMLIAYFAFVIFRIPLDANFVAVELTILGYSLNGTIVIFDRVRENRRLADKKVSTSEIVNISINQTFSRSINTTLTTFVAVAVIAVIALVVNLDSLISLTVPMMFGLLSGFYSSTFLACTFWAGWAEKREAVAKDKKASKKRKKKA